MKYQKKPVTVEAWKLDSGFLINEVPEWVKSNWIKNVFNYDMDDETWHIETLEGFMFAKDGDYLIKGVHGELYSCKPDIFEETYVKVDDTDRISPDDIGNDIHEFLHGGDK